VLQRGSHRRPVLGDDGEKDGVAHGRVGSALVAAQCPLVAGTESGDGLHHYLLDVAGGGLALLLALAATTERFVPIGMLDRRTCPGR